jgi:hypothetical protein
MTKKTNFENSYLRLKEINELLKSDEVLYIDTILTLQKEAEKLHKFCKKMLTKINNS